MGQAHSSGSDDTAPEKSQPVKKQKRSTKISAGNQEAIVQSKPPQSKRKRERQSKGSLPKRRRQDSDTKPKKSKQSTVPQPKQSRNTQPKRTKQTKDSQPRKPKQSTQSKRRPKQSTQSKRTLKQSTQSKRRLNQSGNSQPKNKKLAKNAQSKKPIQPRNTQQNKASDAAEIRDDLTACCTQQARDRGVLLTVKVEDEEQIEDELDDDRIKVEVKEEDEQYINTDDPLDINQLTSTGAEDVIGLYTNAEDAAAEEGSQSLVPGGSGVSNQQVCSPTTNWEICETRTIKGLEGLKIAEALRRTRESSPKRTISAPESPLSSSEGTLSEPASPISLSESPVRPKLPLKHQVVLTATVETQTDLTSTMLHKTLEELNQILVEKVNLQQNIESKAFKENYFKDEKMISFYTGMRDHADLMDLVHLLSIKFTAGGSALTDFQQVVLILLRLRLNLSIPDLANRFRITQATCYRVFLKVLSLFYIRMKSLVVWPDIGKVKSSMPVSLKEYFGEKFIIITDCYEVLLDRTVSFSPEAQTQGFHKYDKSVKFMIAVSPQGHVNFVSKAWGGRNSENHIAENCGLLDRIAPGDVVLAERDFGIAESVRHRQGAFLTPAMMAGEQGADEEDTSRVKNLRAIERHIDEMLDLVYCNFKILSSHVPADYMMKRDENGMTTLEKIIVICCALNNRAQGMSP